MSHLDLETLTRKQVSLMESLAEAYGRIELCEDAQYSFDCTDEDRTPCTFGSFLSKNIANNEIAIIPIGYLHADGRFRENLGVLLQYLMLSKSAQAIIACGRKDFSSAKESLASAFAAIEKINLYALASQNYDGYVLQVGERRLVEGLLFGSSLDFVRFYPDRQVLIVCEHDGGVLESSASVKEKLWANVLPHIRDAAEKAIGRHQWEERVCLIDDTNHLGGYRLEYGLAPLNLSYGKNESVGEDVPPKNGSLGNIWLDRLMAIPKIKKVFIDKEFGD